MFADRDNGSSPGLRALLGRFVQGLLPQRLLQRVGAVWSYLMGPWDASSLLPSGWFVHRSVRSVELPEVLEALGLRSGSWEELGECWDELTPWKELLTPELQLDLLKACQGQAKDCELAELAAWQRAMVHGNMQVLWESWKEAAEASHEECHKSANPPLCPDDQKLPEGLDPCRAAQEKGVSPLQASPLGLISYILSVGAAGGLPKPDCKNDSVLDNPSQAENDIQHIRKKRLRFLHQHPTEEARTAEVTPEVSAPCESPLIVSELPDPMCVPSPASPSSNHNADLLVSDCVEGQSQICDQCELLSNVSLTPGNVLELPEINGTCSFPDRPVLLQEVDNSASLHHACPPSPDKDQGYHSLEFWQSSPLIPANTETPESCALDEEHVLPASPTELLVEEETHNQDSEFMDSDPQDEIPISSVTFCTNKHIGYILGTIVSDDDEDDDDSCPSSCDEWDKEDDDDDGFDSEGSVSTTDSESFVPQDPLWNSFCSADPYNLQNFTASLQTGVITRETVLPLETHDQNQSDEELWSDSDTESSSDCSVDEEQNLKLWNSFLKSDDPYNPLYFKAHVQTSVTKTKTCEAASIYSETVCKSLSNKVTSVAHQGHDLQLPLKEVHNMKDRTNLGHKKVTFHEKVTIYYVCNEERKGQWEELARDRCRFQRRIKEVEFVIGHCLTPDHRQRAWKKIQGHWGS